MIEDLKRTLWATTGKLRASMDAAEYKHLMLSLIFGSFRHFQDQEQGLDRALGRPCRRFPPFAVLAVRNE